MNPNFPRETPPKTVNVFSPEKKQNVSKQTATQINYTTGKRALHRAAN
jgi:hypothetical protein